MYPSSRGGARWVRSTPAFVDKVEPSFSSEDRFSTPKPSFCPEDRFSTPKAFPNAPGGVPERSQEHSRTPSRTPHRPHQAEVAPERAMPRFPPLPIGIFGCTPASFLEQEHCAGDNRFIRHSIHTRDAHNSEQVYLRSNASAQASQAAIRRVHQPQVVA